MILKRLAYALVLATAFSASASAGIIYDYHATLESGAAFDGKITLADDYSKVTGVDGHLTGVAYGNDHLNWVWLDGANFAPLPNTYGTFLMDHTPADWAYFLSFTYDYTNAPTLTLSDAAFGNRVNYGESVVSYQLTPENGNVPEPGTLALTGLGLLGLAMRRKSRKQG